MTSSLLTPHGVIPPSQTPVEMSTSAPGPLYLEQLLDEVTGEQEEDLEEEGFGAMGVNITGSGSEMYIWEGGVERSWDKLREKEGGGLEFDGGDRNLTQWKRRGGRGSSSLSVLRRGILRNVILMIDFSESMREMDVKPDRLNCAIHCAENFIREFFSSNPISHLGVIVLTNAQAALLTPLSANPEAQIEVLHEYRAKEGAQGSSSVKAGLERATGLLSCYPPYGTREVILLFGSIKSTDSGDVRDCVDLLKSKGVRVSVVSLTPELFVLKKLCEQTDGQFAVALTPEHVKYLLSAHLVPPPWGPMMETCLVPMGFPTFVRQNTASLCLCHGKPGLTGYFCPRCHAKGCDLPSKCEGCDLHLVASSHIYRTHRHLHPTPVVDPLLAHIKPNEATTPLRCSACDEMNPPATLVRCRQCRHIFCQICEEYMNEVLHECIFCSQRREVSRRTESVHPS